MATAFDDQVSALQREKSRLESLLSSDESWLTLQALTDADPNARSVLTKALSANPYYVAREKILEAIAILERTVPATGRQGQRGGIVAQIGILDGARATTGDDPHQSGTSGKQALSAPPGFVSELTRIKGIDEALAIQLGALGVTRCVEVAAWSSADVDRVRSALGLDKRISRENWIEQAAILAPLMPAPESKPVPASAAPPISGSASMSSPEILPEPSSPEPAANSFSTFARPPLFDISSDRITPPFVARTLPPAADISPAPSVAVAQAAAAPPPMRTTEARLPVESSHDAPVDLQELLDTGEADVVIVPARTHPPKSAPAAHTPVRATRPHPTGSHAEVSPPLRDPEAKRRVRDVDTTPYSGDRGLSEEAEVEIVRPRKSP